MSDYGWAWSKQTCLGHVVKYDARALGLSSVASYFEPTSQILERQT
jgi:hypothetical protein